MMHPAPGDREELVPEQLLIPPDQDWLEPVPQTIEQEIPTDDVLLAAQGNLPVNFLRIALPQPDAVNAQNLEDLPASLPGGALFNEEEAEISNEEEQWEEDRSGMSAALAILSLSAGGAYWTIRDRRPRRVASELIPVCVEAM